MGESREVGVVERILRAVEGLQGLRSKAIDVDVVGDSGMSWDVD